MQAKTIQQAPDPNLGPEQEAANRTLITGLQNQAEIDTASLMARYGTKLALSGAGMSPMSSMSPARMSGASPPIGTGTVRF